MNKFEEYLEAVREAVLLQEGDQEYEYSEAKRKIGIARPEKYKGKVIDYGSFIAKVTMKLSDFVRKNNIKMRYSEVGSESKGSEKVAMHYLDLGSNGKLYLDVNQENGNVVGYIIHALGGVQFSSGPHKTVDAMVKAVKNYVTKKLTPAMESFDFEDDNFNQISEATKTIPDTGGDFSSVKDVTSARVTMIKKAMAKSPKKNRLFLNFKSSLTQEKAQAIVDKLNSMGIQGTLISAKQVTRVTIPVWYMDITKGK